MFLSRFLVGTGKRRVEDGVFTSDEWGNHLVVISSNGYAHTITNMHKDIVVTHGDEREFAKV